MRKIPEYGVPGYGVKAACVGSWIIPCGEMLNWSRLTRQLSMIVFVSPAIRFNFLLKPSKIIREKPGYSRGSHFVLRLQRNSGLSGGFQNFL